MDYHSGHGGTIKRQDEQLSPKGWNGQNNDLSSGHPVPLAPCGSLVLPAGRYAEGDAPISVLRAKILDVAFMCDQ
jgi:hypothetical protein